MSVIQSVVFKAAALIPILQEASRNQCPLLLVKDSGLYLMAEQGERVPETGRRQVAYAEGFDPDNVAFDDWYDALRDICGGDDFAETLSADSAVFQRVLSHNVDIRIEFTQTTLTVLTSCPE